MTNEVQVVKVEDLSIADYEELRVLNNGEDGSMQEAIEICRDTPGLGVAAFIRPKKKIVSWVLLYKVRDGHKKLKDGTPKYLHMVNMFTHPRYRKKGYNSKILEVVCKMHKHIYGQSNHWSYSLTLKHGIKDADNRFDCNWTVPGDIVGRYLTYDNR